MHSTLSHAYVAEWLTAWGYLGIFLCVFVGNLGVPVPEETVLLAAGFLSAEGILDVRTVFIVAVVSAVFGDNCGYALGRTGGQRLLDRLSGTFGFVEHRYLRFKDFFHLHGNKTVFLARFITGLRFMAGPMAGVAGMPFWSFFGWNVLGALVWCATMVAIGHLIGDQWDYVAGLTRSAGRWVALALILAAVAAYFTWWRERSSPASGSHQ